MPVSMTLTLTLKMFETERLVFLVYVYWRKFLSCVALVGATAQCTLSLRVACTACCGRSRVEWPSRSWRAENTGGGTHGKQTFTFLVLWPELDVDRDRSSSYSKLPVSCIWNDSCLPPVQNPVVTDNFLPHWPAEQMPSLSKTDICCVIGKGNTQFWVNPGRMLRVLGLDSVCDLVYVLDRKSILLMTKIDRQTDR